MKVYGESMPLRDVALISTRDAQTLVVSLYDASVRPATLAPCFRIQGTARFAHPLFFDTPRPRETRAVGPRPQVYPCASERWALGVGLAQTSQEVERAILESPLGLNPKGGSDTIIVPVPPMSSEARTEVAKIVSSSAEHAKVAVRARRKEVRAYH